VNLKQTEEPGDRLEEPNALFAGTVVLVTVWVVPPLLIQRTVVFAEAVMVPGLNKKSWMATSVVPVPGHATKQELLCSSHSQVY